MVNLLNSVEKGVFGLALVHLYILLLMSVVLVFWPYPAVLNAYF